MKFTYSAGAWLIVFILIIAQVMISIDQVNENQQNAFYEERIQLPCCYVCLHQLLLPDPNRKHSKLRFSTYNLASQSSGEAVELSFVAI